MLGQRSDLDPSVSQPDTTGVLGREVSRRGFMGGGLSVVAGLAIAEYLPNHAKKETRSIPRYEYLAGYNPEKDKTLGNIRLARIIKGEDFITLKRPSGSKINVPRLRDNGDATSTAESFLALWAAYLTTDKAKAMNAATSDPDTKDQMGGERSLLKVDQAQLTDLGDFVQVVIYDTPEDPVVFSEITGDDGQRTITKVLGTLYFNNAFGVRTREQYDDTWQGKYTRKYPAPAIFDYFDFHIGTNADGLPTVNGFRWQRSPNPAWDL